MTWGVAVATTPLDVEFVSDLLWGLGVVAVSEHLEPNGSITLRTSLGDDLDSLRRALESLPPDIAWWIEEIPDDVGTEWRRHARPSRVSERIVVVPAWFDGPEPMASLVVRIEPGATFGLGDHPTTIASLRMIERHLVAGSSVLDVGCGSGILGITALVLGADRAHGIDVSTASLATSVGNAERNGVARRWSVTNDPLGAESGEYPIVVANILAPTLVELSDDLKRVLASDGVLVISGVLAGRYDHVARALAPLVEFDRIEIDGWVAVAFR